MGLPRYAWHLSGSGWVLSGLAHCPGWCPCPLGVCVGVTMQYMGYFMGESVLVPVHLEAQGVSVDVGPAGRGSDMKGTLLPAMGSVCV